MQEKFSLSGKIVDVINERIFEGTVEIHYGRIKAVREEPVKSTQYILPGLIDAHVHIESSMLVPSAFARLAVVHGTVATVSDPHEIANVLGIEGVNFMIENGKQVPFKFFFGAPSCVPATPFETAGNSFGIKETEQLLKRDEIKYLSEMMNYPGVLHQQPDVMAKLNCAKKYNKPVDGHAPGLTGEDVKKYIESGISTDHECFAPEEAIEKLKLGMKIQIREGSAAKNFEALISLITLYPDQIMLCSDDKHPDDLLEGHINLLIKRAIAKGYDPIKVIRSCTLIPVNHYKLDVGLGREGDAADLTLIDNLTDFNVLTTYINGIKVSEKGQSLIEPVEVKKPNKFQIKPLSVRDIQVPVNGKKIKVIQALDGQLITRKMVAEPKTENGYIISDIDRDILKIVVLNRYTLTIPAVGFINGFGFKHGAMASTVAHDSHNIIAVGTNDNDIVHAINKLIETKGGICIADSLKVFQLPLPIAGIMSDNPGEMVARDYKLIHQEAINLGSHLHAPFMTLSFMALLVIPELKMSDKGLFDGNTFTITSIFEE